MAKTRTFACRLPNGEVVRRTRRHDQPDPTLAIVTTTDSSNWEVYRMSAKDHEILRCVKEILALGQSAFVTRPWPVKD